MAISSSLLWELNHPELQTGSSYLFGTMHVGDHRAHQFIVKVKPYLESCDAFALEYHLDEMANTQSNPVFQRAYFSPNGQWISQLLPQKKYTKLRKIIQKAVGLDIHRLQHFKPVILSNMILTQMLSKDYPKPLDHQLWSIANDQNKQLLGIETFEHQINILANIPLDNQMASLLDLGRQITKHRQYIQKTANLYAAGNLRQLHKLVARNIGGNRRLLMTERNIAMADKLHQFAQQQSIFVAIGAGHLAGKHGVLRLLKIKGWKVKPVKI